MIRSIGAASLVFFAACTGGSTGGGPGGSGGTGGAGGSGGTGGGGSVGQPPQAAFALSTGPYTAGTALTVDATASTDPDGDALTYSWDFGDGTRGGGRQLAHTFVTAGSFTVQLTVADGQLQSAVQQTVTVAAGPVPSSMVAFTLGVKDVGGADIAGATVALVGTATQATTNAMGKATLMVGATERQTLRVGKTGYAGKTLVVTLPATVGPIEQLVYLRPRAAAVQISAATGGTLTGTDGIKLELPPGALVTASGTLVTGTVAVNLTPLDVVKQSAAFPGRFEGTRTTGASGLLLSYGTAEVLISQGNAPVQLAAGKTATIELPLYADRQPDGTPLAAGVKIPLWSLDERTGGWVEEGEGTVVTSTAAASGFAYRATVGHFSWWNADKFDATPSKPKPKCCIDGNADGVCDGAGDPAYCWVRGTTDCASAFGCKAVNAAPAFNSETIIPSTGGVALAMPADVDVYLIGFSPGLTHRGQLVYRGAANAADEPTIVMAPYVQNMGVKTVTVPSVTDDLLTNTLEVDGWEFTGQAGEMVHVAVSRPTGNGAEGRYTLTGPNGYTVKDVAFGLALGSVGRTALRLPSSGTWRIDVKGVFGLPTTYQLSLQRAGPSPWIESTQPTSGSATAGPATVPTVTMSGPVNAGVATLVGTELQFLNASYPGSTVSADGGPTVTFEPGSPLYSGTLYKLKLAPALQAQPDDGGVFAQFGGNLQIPFRTAEVAGSPALCGRDNATLGAVTTAGDKAAIAWDFNGGISSSVYRPGEGWVDAAQLRGGRMSAPSTGSNGPHGVLAFVQVRVPGMVTDSQLFVSRISDGGWSPLVALTTDAGQIDGVAPAIAIEPSGRTVVAWSGGGQRDYWARQSSPDGGWGAAELLHRTPQMSGGSRIDVASNAGTDTAVWIAPEADGGGLVIRAARFDGAAWQPSALLRPFGGNSVNQNTLASAVDGEGNALAIWHDGTGHTGAVYRADAGWQPSAVNASGAANFCTDQRPVAVGLARGFMVAGCEAGPPRAVWTRTYDPLTDQWSAATSLSTPAVALVQHAFTRSGGAAATWWRDATGPLHWRVFTNGAWSGPADLLAAPVNSNAFAMSSAGKLSFFFPVSVATQTMCGAVDVN